MSSDDWHYVERGSSKGPFSTLEMEALIARGDIAAQTLVWNETLPAWETAARHFEMSARPMPDVPGRQAMGELGRDGLYVGAPSRGFVEALKICFAKYITFSGRASRSEYWYFVLWQVIIGFVAGFADGLVFGLLSESSPLNSIASLVLLPPTLAVSWRRLHDLDRSGWWIGGFYLALIAMVVVFLSVFAGFDMDTTMEGPAVILTGVFVLGVVIYSIIMLVFFCSRGTPGPNRYG